MSENWQIQITLKDADRDEAHAFAQGIANTSGMQVELLREHGEVQVATLNPKKR